MKSYWRELDDQGRFLLTKLVGGGFRVDAKRVAQRMMGYTDGKSLPSVERFQALVAKEEEGAAPLDEGQPYPFFLAHQLDAPPAGCCGSASTSPCTRPTPCKDLEALLKL